MRFEAKVDFAQNHDVSENLCKGRPGLIFRSHDSGLPAIAKGFADAGREDERSALRFALAVTADLCGIEPG